MTTPLEIWGGHECTVHRVGAEWRDQTRLSGHHDRPDDLDLFARLGLRALRYPVLWERTELAPGVYDWRWADTRLERLQALGVRPILGLVHHGSGPAWTNLLDPAFPEGLARFAGAVAERYPWVRDWIPVNEPLTTARFSALYGRWYPHARNEGQFWLAVTHQLEGVRAAMQAIRAVAPDARLIQTEDFGRSWGTGPCAEQARHENIRRLFTWDVLTGRFTREHPLHDRLGEFWLATRLGSFVRAPCPPDVIGVNHQVTSDRVLDHRLERYPRQLHGGNGKVAYADVEAGKVVKNLPDSWLGALSLLWDRYRIPIAVTECRLGCPPDQQVRWLEACWRAAIQARRAGVEVVAITPWALLGSHDWDSLLTSAEGRYEPGVFDVSSGRPRPTELAALVRELAFDGAPARPSAPLETWWTGPAGMVRGRASRRGR